MGTRLRAALAALISVTVAASLSGCVPGGDDGGSGGEGGTLDLVSSFSQLGIAVTPFDGGEPVKPVTGTPVLALTDWQVEQMERSFPVAGEDGQLAASGGISLGDLDASMTAAGITDPDGVYTARLIVLSWWMAAESPRADFARELLPAPDYVEDTVVIPDAIATLFLADGLSDLGRTDAGPTAAADDGTRVVAMGAGAAGGVGGACATIQAAVDGVNGVIASAGPLGPIIQGGLGKLYDAGNGLTGGALKMISSVISMLNMVLSVASLLTHWELSWKHAPAGFLNAGQNGAQGDIGSITAKVKNPDVTVPGNVASCLKLLGIVDPTSLEGSALTPIVHIGIPLDAQFVQGLITQDVSPLPETLDANNEANFNIAAGTQIFDTTQPSQPAYGFGQIELHIERADVKKVTDYILSFDNSFVQTIMGTTLPDLASTILTLSSLSGWEKVGVQYLVKKDTPPPPVPFDEFEWDAGPKQNQSIPTGKFCRESWVIEWFTHQQVVEHWETIDPGGASGGAPPNPFPSCTYRLHNGNIIGYTPILNYPSDEAAYLNIAFESMLNETTCYRSGELVTDETEDLKLGGQIVGHGMVGGGAQHTYFVWDGSGLGSAGVYANSGPNTSKWKDWTVAMLVEAGMCPGVGYPGMPTEGQFGYDYPG